MKRALALEIQGKSLLHREGWRQQWRSSGWRDSLQAVFQWLFFEGAAHLCSLGVGVLCQDPLLERHLRWTAFFKGPPSPSGGTLCILILGGCLGIWGQILALEFQSCTWLAALEWGQPLALQLFCLDSFEDCFSGGECPVVQRGYFARGQIHLF